MYLTDDEAHTHMHIVLRLPVAHCELNPIELAWGFVKGYVAKHNKTHNLPEIEQHTCDGFIYTTTDMWKIYCRHVVDTNDCFEKYGLVEDTLEEFIIEIGEDDSSNDNNSDIDDDTMDKDDKQLINEVLQKITEFIQTICTNPRRSLTEVFKDFD